MNIASKQGYLGDFPDGRRVASAPPSHERERKKKNIVHSIFFREREAEQEKGRVR